MSADKNLLRVSFVESTDKVGGPFSSHFEFSYFTSHPAAAGSNNAYLYTRQFTCLDGRAALARGDESLNAKIYLCFTINDASHGSPGAPRIHTGSFPVATRTVHETVDNPESFALGEVNTVFAEVTVFDPNTNQSRVRKVVLLNESAEGSIDITVSQRDRLAGKFNIKDGNLTITGSFDCPSRY
ncbi:MAG TPA: hypothetical protein VN643_10915 [Pyrinomonadaceae bacterium]|nr:hypothetical protein [Pyrinomonadaceae bacterium]